MNAEQIKARMAEIEANMNAHKQGWVSWSPSTLAEWREEYSKLSGLLSAIK